MERLRTLPETRYAKSGDVHIAYQIVGTGPLDLVVVPASSLTSNGSGRSPPAPACWAGWPPFPA
jgi:hypothetical protein